MGACLRVSTWLQRPERRELQNGSELGPSEGEFEWFSGGEFCNFLEGLAGVGPVLAGFDRFLREFDRFLRFWGGGI